MPGFNHATGQTLARIANTRGAGVGAEGDCPALIKNLQCLHKASISCRFVAPRDLAADAMQPHQALGYTGIFGQNEVAVG